MHQKQLRWFAVASDLDGGQRTRSSSGSVLPVTPGGKDGDVALIPADRLTLARGRGEQRLPVVSS